MQTSSCSAAGALRNHTQQELVMSSVKDSAAQFFDACETGKGWDTCRQ